MDDILPNTQIKNLTSKKTDTEAEETIKKLSALQEEKNKTIDDKTEITNSVPLQMWAYQIPYNKMRRAKLILFGASLNHYDEFGKMPYDNKTKLLKKLERACYNYTIERCNEENVISSWDIPLFCDIYHSICYKISANLDPTSVVNSTTLAKSLLRGELDIANIPKLTSIEMCPNKYVKILERIELSKKVKQTIKYSTMYVCKKCKGNQCTIENRYNRSLDEGVNLVVICQICGHEFGA